MNHYRLNWRNYDKKDIQRIGGSCARKTPGDAGLGDIWSAPEKAATATDRIKSISATRPRGPAIA